MNKAASILATLVAVVVIIAVASFPHWVGNEVVTSKVTKTERVCSSSSDCKYLVYTEQEVFKNTDTTLRMKWNSSDLYGKTLVGQTYAFKVYGLRIGFLSTYRNIVSMESVK